MSFERTALGLGAISRTEPAGRRTRSGERERSRTRAVKRGGTYARARDYTAFHGTAARQSFKPVQGSKTEFFAAYATMLYSALRLLPKQPLAAFRAGTRRDARGCLGKEFEDPQRRALVAQSGVTRKLFPDTLKQGE